MTTRSWIRRLFARSPRTGTMSACRRLRCRPALEILEDRVVPSNFTVNSNGDSGTGSGTTGDLRYCITQANTVGGSNTIDFSFPSAAISLNSALPTITNNLTINGKGANRLIIDGQGASSILSTDQDKGAQPVIVNISGLNLINGSASFGGAIGIFGHDSLTITDCVIAYNTATVNAGGVLNDFSTLTLIGCTLSGNSAGGYGGAIQNEGGSLTLIDCTLASNSAGYKGGGIASTGGASTTVVSCTLAGNSAPLASGGGLFNDNGDTTTMYNTIVANDAGGDVSNAGTLTGGNNLVQDGSDGLSDTIKRNPLLAPLSSYGGPTQTMALFAGSPAIGKADATLSIPGLPGTDQRGFDRVVNNLEDIGAFQTQGGQGVTPTVAITAPQIAVAQAVVTFSFTVTDPTPHDQAGTFAYLIDWNGDGSDLQIVQSSGALQVTHAYATAGSYTPTVTVIDRDGRSSFPTAVTSPYVVAALDGSALDQAIQSLASVTLQVSNVTQENTAFAAINSLPPSPGTGTGVTITMAPGTYTDANVNTSSGTPVTVQGTTPQQWSQVQNTTGLSGIPAPIVVGGSPALEVDQGTTTWSGLVLRTPTDAPTILVKGGTLILQDDFVLGTPYGDRPVIEVDGGTLILVTQTSAGGSVLAAYGTAAYVHVTGSGQVIDLGGNAYDQVASNGTFSSVPGQLTVAQLASSAPAPVYGQSVTFTATVTNPAATGGAPTGSVEFYDGPTDLGPGSALSGSGNAATSTFSTATLTAGDHAIRAVYTPTGIFQATSDTLNQTVNQATLTVTAGNATRYYGTDNPSFTYTITGFVNNDPASVVSGTPTLTTTATDSSAPDNYAINVDVSPLSASNYTFQPVSGTLAVSPAPLLTTAVNFSATAGAPFSGTVATFTTPDRIDGATAFTAVITWGDGSTSSGSITGSNGSFTVTGSHTYAGPANEAVSVQISHNLGYTTTATVPDEATVTSLGQAVTKGSTGGIGFWHNKNGQALINSFNTGPSSTALANWLAASFPNLYGSGAGANDLTGMTNAQVAAFYQAQFALGGPKVQAQVLAVALNLYATTSSLGGDAGAAYGFTVSATGLGARSYSVGQDGAAFGVANNTTLDVYQLLLAVNQKAVNGVLYGGNATLQALCADLLNALNQAGSIG
jgi:hypothetical protein